MPGDRLKLSSATHVGFDMPNHTASARRARWIDALAADARFALRYFARHKGTTALIVAVLAIGTGANTLIFSIFQSEFVRPAPAMPKDDGLLRIWGRERATRGGQFEPRLLSQPEMAALGSRSDVFRELTAWTQDVVILGGDSAVSARSAGAQFVTPNYFRMIGVPLAAGAGLNQTTDNNSADFTAVMSYPMAEQLYGGAAAAIGREVLVNERPVRIVGVAPPRFQGARKNMGEPALWMPVSARAEIAHVSPRWLIDESVLTVLARLAPNASRDQGEAFANQVVSNMLPDSASRVGMARTAHLLGMQQRPPDASLEVVLAFTAISALGILILLVGWMNVSSLMVAAAVGRRHEVAVRLSLGASRPRLLRQLVTESTLLALAGGAVGLTVAWWTLIYMAKDEVTGVTLTPDVGTFAFVLAMAIATGILFGLSPALHATRGGVAKALRDSGIGASSRSRLQRGFVVAQIALSQPLLVVLGVIMTLIISDYEPLSPEVSRHVIATTLRPLANGAPGQRPEAVDSLIPRIAARPEVLAAVPAATAFSIRGVIAVDRDVKADSAPTVVHLQGSAPGWFGVMDVPIILGRDVAWTDTAATEHQVVIGSDMARALWGNANPIGRRLASPSLPGLSQDSLTLTVVGVYDATKQLPEMTFGGDPAVSNSPFQAYTSTGKHWNRGVIHVRTRAVAEPFLPTLQEFLRVEAASLPVISMLTLEQIDKREYRESLQIAIWAGLGGAAALLLASLGLYGVVSLAVRQRAREIGIRIAVGAHPMQVARMFLRSGVKSSLVALALGLPLSIIALKVGLAQGILIAPEVNPWLIGIVIAPILVAVATAATWVPARRAARVDPAKTLRVE